MDDGCDIIRSRRWLTHHLWPFNSQSSYCSSFWHDVFLVYQNICAVFLASWAWAVDQDSCMPRAGKRSLCHRDWSSSEKCSKEAGLAREGFWARKKCSKVSYFQFTPEIFVIFLWIIWSVCDFWYEPFLLKLRRFIGAQAAALSDSRVTMIFATWMHECYGCSVRIFFF